MQVGHWGGGRIVRVTSGEFLSNAYICETGGGNCVLIDGGLDPQSIDNAMQQFSLTPTAMFCTHGHFDHAGSAKFFEEKHGCTTYLHEADHKLFKASNFMLMSFKFNSRIEQPKTIQPVIDGQAFLIAPGCVLTFHATPGHTPGSCIIELGNALFTGDTIYCRGVGLSHLPGEDVDMLRQSILSIWPLLTAERTIFPGHGDSASGADVAANNCELINFLKLN